MGSDTIVSYYDSASNIILDERSWPVFLATLSLASRSTSSSGVTTGKPSLPPKRIIDQKWVMTRNGVTEMGSDTIV